MNFNEIPTERDKEKVRQITNPYTAQKLIEDNHKSVSIKLFLSIRLVFGSLHEFACAAFHKLREKLKDKEIEEFYYKGKNDAEKRRPYQHQTDMKRKISYDHG